MADDGFQVTVESAAVAEKPARPRLLRFHLGRSTVEVAEILDHWPGADHAYVKLRGSDEATYILRHDRRLRLLEIRVPTLVIVAQDDMITPRFYSEELAGRIPGAKLVVLETGGHFAPAIHSEPYNAAVGQFLGSI